jgi:hypothetical protein
VQTSCELFQLQRDEDAEPVTELKDGGEPDESVDSGDDQPQVADSVAVDRPTVEAIEVRRQPGLEKKVVQLPQPQMTSARNGSVPPIPKARFLMV